MKSSKHTALLISGSLIALLFFSSITLSIALAFFNNGRIAYGIHSGSTSLSGMSQEEAQTFFQRTAHDRLQKNALLLSYQNKNWQITAKEIRLAADPEAAAAKAYAIGRSGSLLENIRAQLICLLYGQDVQLTASYDADALQEKLAAIAAALNREPANAFCSILPDGQLKHTPAIIGQKLDTEALTDELAPDLIGLALPVRRELSLEMAQPAIKDEDLASADSILAVYRTHFGSNANRSENIRLAAAKLNGVLIRSGSEFSFNDTVGSRIAAAGYKNAAVIIEGKVEQDIGGGVCQVSSTLYNAVLLAGLQSTVRTAHFYPSAYVPAGRDATVADGQIDFKFRNVLPHNVYLLSVTSGRTLSIYVLGTRADLGGNDIRLEAHTEKAGPGPVVSVYRVYSQNGQTIEREFLHTDHYDIPN